MAQVSRLETDPDLAERVEAFVGRFGRLQDTVGDKLLPLLLTALGEKTGAAIDNLDRAERLRLVHSTDEWINMRNLRNQMVHEYTDVKARIQINLSKAVYPPIRHASVRSRKMVSATIFFITTALKSNPTCQHRLP